MRRRSFEQFGALLRATPRGAEDRLNRLLYQFRSGLNVRRRGLTYVLEISFTSEDPAKAALISQTVAELYIGDQRSSRAEITTRASGWLDERLTAMRERVRDAERAVADYKAANGIVDVTQGNKLISRQIEDLTKELALARTRTADARARLERVEQIAKTFTDPAALAESLQSPVIANLRSQYAEAARLNAENSALLGERHPSLIAVRSQLQTIRRQIEQEIARIISGVRHDQQAAEDREKELEQGLARLATQSATATQADVRLHELEREAQANRSLFEQFLLRARETTEQQSLQIADARIISPALVPLRQDRPPTLILLAAAGVAGVMLGFGLVLLMEHMRRGIRDGAEIESLTDLPYIASVPLQGAGGVERSSWWRRLSSKPRPDHPLSGLCHAGLYGDSWEPPDAASRRRCAAAGRCRRYHFGGATRRKVDVRLQFRQGRRFQRPEDAADRRRCAQCVHNQELSHFRRRTFGALEWQCVTLECDKQDSQSALSVLGARDVATAPPRASNFGQAAIANLLAECRKHFDLIVVDSPALLPMIGSTLPLIESADRALLLVQWEATDRQAVLEILAALGTHTRKIVGVVLNKVAMDWYRLFDSGRYSSYSENANRKMVASADRSVARSLVPVPNVVETGVPSGNARARTGGFRLD